MEEITIKQISKKIFDAYVLTSRSPRLQLIGEEIMWFTNNDESIIGTIVHDTIDNDYAAIMLGKDEIGRFRAFNYEVSLEKVEHAVTWITNTIKWYPGLGKKIFPQGDPSKEYKLFETSLPRESLHPYFVRLNSDDAFLPAKKIINNIMPYFIDIDGNFIEQFQTTGFDSRIWELYLFSYFIEDNFEFDRRFERPDFILTKYDAKIAVEAVTVGRKGSEPKYLNLIDSDYFERIEKTIKERDEMAIKYGSPLFTKLGKKYWELPHVANIPLVFAIADFHEDYSMTWSSTYLINYLYGIEHEYHHDENGKLVIEPRKIEKHIHKGKEIPSGFFFQPNSENVSGVLFSSSGTISKFTRMGVQVGYGQDNIKVIRYGTCHKHDPKSSKPDPFHYEVTEKTNETWGEGLNLFHNPKAKFPIDPELFPTIAHHFLRSDGNIVSYLPDFHPYSSITVHMRTQ